MQALLSVAIVTVAPRSRELAMEMRMALQAVDCEGVRIQPRASQRLLRQARMCLVNPGMRLVTLV